MYELICNMALKFLFLTSFKIKLFFEKIILGNPALDQDWHGDAKSDDWVHVTTPSPTSAPLGETWATAADVYQQVCTFVIFQRRCFFRFFCLIF